MALFNRQEFISAAGIPLTWKIDCDVLSYEDWETIAWIGSQRVLPFGRVIGVPRGGIKLANAFRHYATHGATLFVDDVWTTGKSMCEVVSYFYRGGGYDWFGFVAFARGPLPPNVKCFMKTGG